MRAVMYLKRSAARAAAEREAAGGLSVRPGAVESGMRYLEEDPAFAEAVGCWGGECPAYVVEDVRGQVVARFGWWEDDE